jgi:hypothetical protein
LSSPLPRLMPLSSVLTVMLPLRRPDSPAVLIVTRSPSVRVMSL